MRWIPLAAQDEGIAVLAAATTPEKHDSDASREGCSTRARLIEKIFEADPLLCLCPLSRQQWLAQEFRWERRFSIKRRTPDLRSCVRMSPECSSARLKNRIGRRWTGFWPNESGFFRPMPHIL
jgi:hypothetical protein